MFSVPLKLRALFGASAVANNVKSSGASLPRSWWCLPFRLRLSVGVRIDVRLACSGAQKKPRDWGWPSLGAFGALYQFGRTEPTDDLQSRDPAR